MEKKKNLAASLRAKLTNHAKEKGEDLQNLLIRYANERLLYRLSQSEHKTKFMLKGAALFAFWFNEPHRPTSDMDLLGFGENDIPTLENIFRELCAVDYEDGLNFLADTAISGSNNLSIRLNRYRISFVIARVDRSYDFSARPERSIE